MMQCRCCGLDTSLPAQLRTHPRTSRCEGPLMPPQGSLLGIMKPVGGGDPVPLRKNELTVGRRPSNDICLDFENISGKHCVVLFHNQVWHVRDLGSTNGTTVNGAPIASEHTVMPDDELAFAGHIYHIDYEPGAPATILNKDH